MPETYTVQNSRGSLTPTYERKIAKKKRRPHLEKKAQVAALKAMERS